MATNDMQLRLMRATRKVSHIGGFLYKVFSAEVRLLKPIRILVKGGVRG